MKQTCPECRTVSRSQEPYCAACGFSYGHDRVREMAWRPRHERAAAVCAGLAVAVVQFFVTR